MEEEDEEPGWRNLRRLRAGMLTKIMRAVRRRAVAIREAAMMEGGYIVRFDEGGVLRGGGGGWWVVGMVRMWW